MYFMFQSINIKKGKILLLKRSLSRNGKNTLLKLLASLFSIGQKINSACRIVVFFKLCNKFWIENFWLVINFQYFCFLLYMLAKLSTLVLNFVKYRQAVIVSTNLELPESTLQITKTNPFFNFWRFLNNYFKITWHVIWNLILMYQKRNF